MSQAEVRKISLKEVLIKTEEIADDSYEKMFSLMKKERNSRIKMVYELVQANIGDYIALSGKVSKKNLDSLDSGDFYRIIELSADGLVLEIKGGNQSFLPVRHFNQGCKVLSEEEYFERVGDKNE